MYGLVGDAAVGHFGLVHGKDLRTFVPGKIGMGGFKRSTKF